MPYPVVDLHLFFHLHDFKVFCVCNKPANRGQCVTEYGAAVRPAVIGGRVRLAVGEQVGEEDAERWAIVAGGLLWNREQQTSLRSLNLLMDNGKAIRSVNYFPYHKVYL